MEYINIYNLGLFLVVLYLIVGFDDSIWNIIALYRNWTYKKTKLKMNDLRSEPPKLIAMVIAAWKEDNVIEDVIDNIIESQIYPKSMYHIFLGVYPNDYATIETANNLAIKYSNVHVVINIKDGPTTKAQNINYVISKIKEFESQRLWRFSTITIHDSEDIVHPYELLVTNYLINMYPALQFPVFPLMKMPTLNNFFRNITVNTYADEFAENHFITMVNRHRLGAFVPSAGTGFSISRDTIETLGYEILPEDSLTEDYKLSLTLYEKGIQMHYVMERLIRVNSNGKIIWDYIATRSIFPSTFKTAVKQKTRWITGITMQSYKMKSILKNNISIVGRYSIYKDQKAKVANLLSPIGYPVIGYFIVSFFISLEPMYPIYSFSWYLSLIVLIMTIERQTTRAVALYNIYGFRSVFYGVLFPPLLPFRIIWGNLINFTATVKAYKMIFEGNNKKKKRIINEKKVNTLTTIKIPMKKKPIKWDKTDHTFVNKSVLNGYHRKLGDLLIENGIMNGENVDYHLKKKSVDETFGHYLLRNQLIEEKELLNALATVNNLQIIEEDTLKSYDFYSLNDLFSKEIIQKYCVLPILSIENTIVLVASYMNFDKIEDIFREFFEGPIIIVLARKDLILSSIESILSNQRSIIEQYEITINHYTLDPEQIVIARNYACKLQKKEKEIYELMGIGNESSINDCMILDDDIIREGELGICN